jgi:hypothetical protein
MCKLYDTARRFKVKGQAEIALHEFLKATTDSVCDSINAMSPTDIHALQPRYVKKDYVQDQRPPKINTKDEGKSSIPSKKSPGSVSVKKERVSQPLHIDLPSIVALLEQEKGLMGVLQADIFHVFNTHFGSNQTIACKILLCLGSG